MADPAARDRLQPSLLDRLADDDPTHCTEAPDARVIDVSTMRKVIMRDLGWLFNTTRAEPARGSDDTEAAAVWSECSAARRSVINFGLPPLSGKILTGRDIAMLEREVRDAIAFFEPRMDADTLVVKAVSAKSQGRGGSTVRFQIRGTLWSQPVPLEVLLRSDLDVETGTAVIQEDR